LRYQFPLEYNNQNLKDNAVNQLALTKMSTALASWRTRVKKRIDKKES
jgi:CTP synthase (UTP-ammonia lyase)